MSLLETELKLQFSSQEEMAELWKSDWFVDILIPDTVKTEYYDTRYYDTGDRALRSFNACIRVREIRDGNYVHTVKIGGKSSGGLHQRYEWNMETANDEFDPSYFIKNAVSDGDPSEILGEVLEAVTGKDMKMICRTSFSRTLSLAGFGDSLMEVCFDNGTLYAGEKKEDLFEMEIELKQGDVRDVLELGEEILAHSTAIRDDRGKYTRCLALLES